MFGMIVLTYQPEHNIMSNVRHPRDVKVKIEAGKFNWPG